MPKSKNCKNSCLSAVGKPTSQVSSVQGPTAYVAYDLVQLNSTDARCRHRKDLLAIGEPTGPNRPDLSVGPQPSTAQFFKHANRLSKGQQGGCRLPRSRHAPLPIYTAPSRPFSLLEL